MYKNDNIVKTSFRSVDYFKELPFYNKSIEKPKVKRLKNIDRLAGQLSVIKTDQAFIGYAMTYKVKIIEKKRCNCTIRSK